MKNSLKYFSLFAFTFIVSIYIYHYSFSPVAIKGNRNWQNLKLIKNGMDTSEVIKIMGPPSYIYQMGKRGPIIYSYISPPDHSIEVNVFFDLDKRHVICRPN